MHEILTRRTVQQRQQEASGTSVQRCIPAVVLSPREAASLNVLVVDDCPVQRLLTAVLLSRWGIAPELASDGVEAVLLADERQFDIILMDIQMDVLDGIAATIRIRQNERRRGLSAVPVVAYTAERIAADGKVWVAAGISAALAKPSAAAQMGECLQYWCGIPYTQLHH